MHIETNVCDNLLGNIFYIDGKTKDTDKARMDLYDLNIKHELHLYKDGDKCLKPPAAYTLTPSERKLFASFIKSVKFPNGFASNLKKNVTTTDGKLMGLKSHDCHVIMQRLLALGVRSLMKKEIQDTVTESCVIFFYSYAQEHCM